MRDSTRDARWATSSRRCVISEESRVVEELLLVCDTTATVCVATSITLSAMSASQPSSIDVSAEARTILTLGGSLWRNNCRRKEFEFGELSLSWRSCCMCRNSCVGFLVPNSSPLMSCCSFRCSEAAVHLTSWAFRMLYGLSSGSFSGRSRTSMANSGLREMMTQSNRVFCVVMPLVVNCAST